MRNEKILLALLPFWTPLIPPQGISRLKGFLRSRGYTVGIADANVDNELKNIYDRYFSVLKANIPPGRQGNIYNIGNDVWRDHMMAHINRTDEEAYLDLVRMLIYKTFYHHVDRDVLYELKSMADDFYARLEAYLTRLLESERPDVLGLSVYRDTLAASLFAFRLARRINPRIKTVMGGAVFATILPLDSPNLRCFLEKTTDCLDHLIIGPGELLMLKLLRGELPASKRVYTSQDLNGETLDSTMDMLDYTGLELEHYHHEAMAGSFSCPNKCGFCNVSIYLGEYRQRDPAQTVRDMITLYRRHGRQLFYMLDSLLNGVIDAIADAITRSEASLYWDTYLRVDETACDPERVHRWRRGGFYRARMGIESGSQHVLDLMGKTITVEQSRRAISNLAAAGVKTTAYIVIGHPGETDDDFQRTLDLVEELQDDIWEAESNPFSYFYTGQPHADDWQHLSMLLYPESARDMLIAQTWILDTVPRRELMFERVNRFVEHCDALGVSTPWSLYDVDRADRRWMSLHKNAVPPVLDFIGRDRYIDECKHVKRLHAARNTLEDGGDFDFDFD